jgi:hypothetical protein
MGGVPGTGDQPHAAAPQARNAELLEVTQVHQLLTLTVQDRQRPPQGRGDRHLVGEPALADAITASAAPQAWVNAASTAA